VNALGHTYVSYCHLPFFMFCSTIAVACKCPCLCIVRRLAALAHVQSRCSYFLPEAARDNRRKFRRHPNARGCARAVRHPEPWLGLEHMILYAQAQVPASFCA